MLCHSARAVNADQIDLPIANQLLAPAHGDECLDLGVRAGLGLARATFGSVRSTRVRFHRGARGGRRAGACGARELR